MQESLVDGMQSSVELLEEYLSKGYFVYGIDPIPGDICWNEKMKLTFL